MELSYDWKSFQSFFYPKRNLTTVRPVSHSPIYLIIHNRVVISAFSEGEALLAWIGSSVDQVLVDHPGRELIFYEREKVDQWTEAVIGLPHFFDQIQELRSQVKMQCVHRNKLNHPDTWVHRHFLLQALQSWWSKFLPSSYGLYIRLSDKGTKNLNESSIFLIFQRGRLSSFYIPDLSSMVSERRKYASDVVKFLSSKYLVPVQGLFLSVGEWNDWSEMREPGNEPWKKVATALKMDRGKLVPFHMGLVAFVYARAYLKR